MCLRASFGPFPPPLHIERERKRPGYNRGSNVRELRHLKLVLENLKGEEAPVIFTAFTPITIADKISGRKLISYTCAAADFPGKLQRSGYYLWNRRKI